MRQLDAELAAGRLSSDDYRVRRDAVLAKAASGDTGSATPFTPVTPAPAATPLAQPAPLPPAPVPPPAPTPPAESNPAENGPFPPAFRWQDSTPANEATSIIAPITANTPPPADLGADRTQTVRQDDQPERTQIVRNPIAADQGERTQVVSDSQLRNAQQPPHQQQPPPHLSGGYPAPPRPMNSGGWSQQRPMESVPPWGHPDEPMPELGNTPWLHQGPEVFETTKAPKRGKRGLGILIVVVLVLGLGVAAYFYFTKDNGSETGSGPVTPPNSLPTTSATTTASRAPELPDPPAAKPDPGPGRASLFSPLPGTTRPGGGALSLEKMKAEKPFGPETIAALDANGMTDGWLATNTDGANILSLVVFDVKDADAAKAVAAAYVKDQAALRELTDVGYKGVKVFTDSTGSVHRGVYVLYNRVVVVDAFTQSKPPEGVREAFVDLLKNQVEFAPPTGR
ncbi:hypothetical protein Acsp05_48980 [Actinokineospora sp. NBRC 105648]|nr:hypothetical protein Acsp05_48980 [Actinokineospora sp. NBRC 105648]